MHAAHGRVVRVRYEAETAASLLAAGSSKGDISLAIALSIWGAAVGGFGANALVSVAVYFPGEDYGIGF